MNQFKAEQLAAIVSQCEGFMGEAGFAIAFNRHGSAPPDSAKKQMQEWLTNARTVFEEVGLRESLKQLMLAGYHLSDPSLNVAVMESELRRIQETLLVELRSRKFLYVAEDRTAQFENDALFGEKVRKAFPLATDDLKAAGNCFAAEAHTAGVFHLMLAFEWALRYFCADLGLKRLKEWNKKEDKFKYTPADYATWEKLLNQLPAKIAKRLSTLRPGKKKQDLQEYFASVHEDIKATKDAWRNHIMHNRKAYKRDDAQAVYRHVQDIMQRMAR